MRIALVSEHASPLATISGIDAGGQNRHVAGLAAALVAVGHEVTVYTRRDSMVRAGRISAPGGYEVVHVPVGPPEGVPKDELMPYMVPFGSWLSSRFAESKRRPDVVHAHFWMSGIAALRGAMPRQIPVVLTYHAHGNVKRRFQRQDDTSPAGRMSIERQLALVVQRVVAQCSDEVAELMALGVPATQIRLIPSGIDLNQFQPRGPTVNKTGPRLLAVGRPVPRKGFEEVIRILPNLPGVELVVVGGPEHGADRDPEFRRLYQLADALGVTDQVQLVGAVPASEMASWYRSADLVTCTPWYEPFGLTPLEAMACGVPVVTYAVGGLIDSVVDGSTGRQVMPGDRAGLTSAISELLGDAALRRKYGKAAARRVHARYGWNHTAEAMTELYAEVVNAPVRLRVSI